MSISNIKTQEYFNHRSKIKSGDLLIWSSAAEGGMSGLLLNFIRFFTRSEYAHVGIALHVGQRLCVVEAIIPHIQLMPVSKKETFYHIPMNIEWTDDKQVYLLEHLGKDYSIFEAIKAYLNIELKDDSDWQCAEFANRFYKSINLDFGETYTPSGLVQSILSKNYSVVLVNTDNG